MCLKQHKYGTAKNDLLNMTSHICSHIEYAYGICNFLYFKQHLSEIMKIYADGAFFR